MKKVSLAVASLLSVSALALIPSIASADPIGLNITIQCPDGGGKGISNFGEYVAGYGQEIIQNQGSQSVYFKSTILTINTPADLSNYSSTAAQYESTTGKVTCTYMSSMPEQPQLSVAYTLTNGKGGLVQGSSNNSVNIVLPVGRKG